MFKIGDKVRCKSGFDTDSGGAGYEAGFVFEITDISNSHAPIYWKGKDRCGVFEPALEYATITNWKARLND